LPITKISILILYHHIFPQRWFRQTLIGLGAFIIAYVISQTFSVIFQCIPIDSLWGASEARYCVNDEAVAISLGVANILTDIIMLVLPLPVLWNLQMSKSRKQLLTLIFTMGGL
jgi:hypothetical protein